jgi:hypothetical protein
MRKVTTGATMSLDGFIADAHHGGFDYLFKWYGAGDVEVPTGNPDLRVKGLCRQRGAPAAAEPAPGRAGVRPAPVRPDQRLGWPLPAGPHRRGGHPPAARGPAGGRRRLRLCHQRHRGRVAKAEEQSDRPAHASFMDSLLDAGFVILGGPLAGSNAVARSRTIRGASRTSAWRRSTRGPSGSMGGHAWPRLALGQPTYRPQWRRRSWAGFGAGNQRANGRAFMR